MTWLRPLALAIAFVEILVALIVRDYLRAIFWLLLLRTMVGQ